MKELGALLHYGVYVPRLRLPRATIAAAMVWANRPAATGPDGARAICNWDEDALTLAVEAARSCLTPQDSQAQNAVRSLSFCSTTAPFDDRDNAIVLASALDLPESVETLNLAASMRAATTGL